MPVLRPGAWTLSRRAIVAAPLATLLSRRAAAYPERSIRLVVPFTAGGGVDGIARPLGRALADGIGVSVVVDNRGGAGGVIGMDAVAHAPPDGYTLLLSHSG